MKSSLVAAALFLPLAFVLGCTGTGDGGKGDPLHSPHADKLGDGAKLADVLGPATWLDPDDTDSASCSSPAATSVYVTGVTVVAVDRFDETGNGQRGNFYVEDTSVEPVEYSGATVFAPSFSPPDLRLAEGDVADVNGALQEFLGPSSGKFGSCKTLPELSGTLSFRLENGTRTPKAIKLDELKSYETARKWLGMLVKLEPLEGANTLVVTSDPSMGCQKGGGACVASGDCCSTSCVDKVCSSMRYQANLDVGAGVKQSDVPKISNELYDIEVEGPALVMGAQFKSITGIVTYFYGFHIAPRSKDDFELP